MATRSPRVVAELGRPETPDETAARKAASSAAYRGSQTFRNLIVALLVTLAVVLVIVFGVPRGEIPTPESIDPAPIAADAAATYDRDIVVPAIPDEWRLDAAGEPIEDAWRVNRAEIGGAGGATTWTIVYVPSATSFLRVSQGFDTDQSWARSILSGQAPAETVVVDGITWDTYEIARPTETGNISYALGTQAGTDHILVYGTADTQTTEDVAALLTEQIRTMQQEAP